MFRPRPSDADGRLVQGRVQGRARAALRRFRQDQAGAYAVEFALLATPFLALLFGIFEVGLGILTAASLETAVANASRQIYTGQFQTSSSNAGQSAAQLADKFKTLVCNDVNALFDCQSMLKVDVRTFDSFPNASVPSPVKDGQFDSSGFGYGSAGPDQIVVVRAALEYPILVPISQFGDLVNGKRLVMASATFRTEPYRNSGN